MDMKHKRLNIYIKICRTVEKEKNVIKQVLFHAIQQSSDFETTIKATVLCCRTAFMDMEVCEVLLCLFFISWVVLAMVSH